MIHGARNEALRRWQKSSHSSSGSCVEMSQDGTDVLVRDSKNPSQQFLRFNRQEWIAFLAGAKDGEFDHYVG